MFDIESWRINPDVKIGLMAIPTGIGASIGGYAGDASSVAQKISKLLPLVVNPNIVNAAVFSGINDDMLYVEGSAMNDFVKGDIGLLPSKNNKIGIIFDKSIPDNVLNIHINTLNAVKTVYGIDILGYEITEEGVGVEFSMNDSGISSGSVCNPDTLLDAGRKLQNKGAQAIAVVCFFDEPPEDDYENGCGVDIVGGVEAVISHYMSKNLFCPCVHAPAFADVSISEKIVDPKVSAEYITPTFLPCLLLGLKNAPLIVKPSEGLNYKNLHSIVMPYNSLGTSLVFDAIDNKIPVYAVKENKTVLGVDRFSLNLQDDIIELESYDEYIEALKGELG